MRGLVRNFLEFKMIEEFYIAASNKVNWNFWLITFRFETSDEGEKWLEIDLVYDPKSFMIE